VIIKLNTIIDVFCLYTNFWLIIMQENSSKGGTNQQKKGSNFIYKKIKLV